MAIAHSLQSIPFLTDFSESVLAYPLVLSTHLACIALFGGMILLTNLRLLGLTLKGLTITEVVTSFRPWKRLGGVVMIATGAMLAACEAEKYSPNPYFWTKMIILGLIGLHGLIFRRSVYTKTAELDASAVVPTRVKWCAILSLVLWIAMFTMGRMIAYWEPE